MSIKFTNKTRLHTHHSYLIQSSTHLLVTRQEKKKIQIGEVKLFAENMILYLEDKKRLHQKILVLIKEFSKVVRHKINTHKTVVFLYPNSDSAEEGIKKYISFT